VGSGQGVSDLTRHAARFLLRSCAIPLFAEEFQDFFQRPFRLLLRNPMTGVFHHTAAHVDRHALPGFQSQGAAAPSIRTAKAEDWHRQFSLREEGLVVGDILRRGAVEIKGRAHRARLAIAEQVFILSILGDRVRPRAPGAIEEAACAVRLMQDRAGQDGGYVHAAVSPFERDGRNAAPVSLSLMDAGRFPHHPTPGP